MSEKFSNHESAWDKASQSIMTTDTKPKLVKKTCQILGKTINLIGFAKGSGMIAPNMATMLGYIFTDANISKNTLQQILLEAVEKSFNSITVDSDQSTNDTVLIFADKSAEHHEISDSHDKNLHAFKEKLNELCLELAKMIVVDGEGAKKLIEIIVEGAQSEQQAKEVAMSIANSPLVKTAIAGADPNWGRIVMAVGKSCKETSPQKLIVKIGEHPFVFTGVFLLGKENSFQLHITSEQILVDFARSLLTPKISKSIGIVSVKKPLDVDATICGSLAGGDPRVQVKFSTQNNQVDSKFLNMTQCSFTGEYLNEVVPGNGYTDENSHIYVKEMSGIWEGMKLNIKDLNVMNLSHPSIAVQASSKFPLNELNSALQSETMKFTDGQGEFSLNYSGRTDSISSKNSTLTGYLRFKNGTLFLHGPQASIQKCNGVFSFNNANLLVDSLKGELAGNTVYMKGRANNVLSVLSDDHVPVSLDWNIYAPEINLNSIRSVLMRKVSTKQKKSKRKTGISKTVENIDHLLSSGAVTASLKADRLKIEKMDARNFTASIQLEGNTWAVKSA